MATAYTHVLLDIEGTTTPISFVHDVLFPYVGENLDTFLAKRWNDDELQHPYIDDLRSQSIQDAKDEASGVITIPDSQYPNAIKAVADNVSWQMSSDRKAGPLKALQGYMWKDGYANGQLKGVVYPDVLAAFQRWQKANIPIFIYSSGSIAAQKLLFGYTIDGNLLPYLSGHYDTTSGPKTEASSYERIAEHIGIQDKGSVLFLSDNVKEVAAARQAGLQARIVSRPGNAEVPFEEQQKYGGLVTSFDAI